MKPSISTHLFATDQLERAHLEALRGHGFDRIELWGMTPHFDAFDDAQVESLDSWLSELDMAASSLHAPFYNRFGSPEFKRFSICAADDKLRAESQQAALRAVEVAGFLGADLVVVHGPGGAGEEGPDCLKRFSDAVLELGEAGRRAGVRLGLENIITPLSRVNVLIELLDNLENSGIGLCVDLGHLHIEGGLPEDLMLGRERLLSLHISDNHGKHDEHLVPGRGSINWPQISGLLSDLPRLAHAVLEVYSWNILARPDDELVQQSLHALAASWARHFAEHL